MPLKNSTEVSNFNLIREIKSLLFKIVLFSQLRIDQTVGIKFMWTYFPTITIHLSLNVFHWRLETK